MSVSLSFQPFSSAIAVSFWTELSHQKLAHLRLSTAPIPATAVYSPPINAAVSSTLQFADYSLSNTNVPPFTCKVRGFLHNTNSVEAFTSFDTAKLSADVGSALYAAIRDGSALADPTRLNTFAVVTFADLKSHSYYYWALVPALLHPALRIVAGERSPLAAHWTPRAMESALTAYRTAVDASRQLPTHFIIRRDSADAVTLHALSEYSTLDVARADSETLYVAFTDSSALSDHPGWTLRNLLLLAAIQWKVRRLAIIAFRDAAAALDDTRNLTSITFTVELSALSDDDMTATPKIVGWERNSADKLAPRHISLRSLLSPIQLANSSADLNLQLMRWRALPDIDLPKIQSARALLIGAGTLGCIVARTLLGWGVRHITFVDNGVVSYSNPVRQTLFTHDDAVNKRGKAECAAAALKTIHPTVEAAGVRLTVPMPGHGVLPSEVASVIDDTERLRQLILASDVVFLLTDSRESRWLPTLFCHDTSTLCINAALGFDTFLVMRHGERESRGGIDSGLGCYFCNDVVAPRDTMSDRSLDQQCTVTRPGLAYMAGALAVELFVAAYTHPLRQFAPALIAPTDDHAGLGYIPHQIRGFLKRFENILLRGQRSAVCTACSGGVIDALKKDGKAFLLRVLADESGSVLEHVSGWTDMASQVEARMHEMTALEDEDDADDALIS